MSAAALQETQSIQVNPLSAHIGAEIRGVDDRCARFTRCGCREARWGAHLAAQRTGALFADYVSTISPGE